MEMMELDGLADVGSLFGIDGLKDDLMDVAVMGASAGVAVVAGEFIFAKVPWVKDQSTYVQSGIAAVLGIAGGIALGRYVNKGVGAGVAAGLVGWAIAKSIQKVASLPEYSLKGLGQSDSDLLLGLGQSDSDLLLGLGQSENVSVEDFRPMPGQTNGLGQDDLLLGLGQGAGDVEARDLSPLPGGGFIDGVSFMS
jgi:hypothetical protein